MTKQTGYGPARLFGSSCGLVFAVLFVLLSGCAGHERSLRSEIPPAENVSLERGAEGFSASSHSSLGVAADDQFQDEPIDPFAAPGEEGIEEYDPWEPINSKVFEFNRQFDRWLLKPVAKGYNVVVPDVVQVAIGNFFYNIRVTPRFMNNIFQGKFKGASIEAGRFVVNTTAGIGGLFDVAQYLNLITPLEDTGQTLGFYGIPPGPYVVLPFLPPYTVRDLVGYVGDIALNPIYWLVLPLIEIDAIPSVIPHKNRVTTALILMTARGTEIVNDRSLNLERFEGVEESTLDLYAAVRNAYLQNRARAIRE
jgi:phospholipid-binding lipoprotein MlaA